MKKTRSTSSQSYSRRRYQRPTAGGELRQVLRAIQELTLDLAQLHRVDHSAAELEAKEHALDQLHWRLASLARRLATDDLGAAA